MLARAFEDELMDAKDLAPETYAAVMRDLARANTLTLARRPTLAFVARTVGERQSFSLLDVGFGDGDMLRAIDRWARRRGKTARLIGIDLNPRSLAPARAATRDDSIDYRIGDYADLGGEGFDLIVSSLVAHHMTEPQLLDFLRFMEAEAALGWFVNDLHRHRMPHLGFRLGSRLLGLHPIVRHDGALSVRRSFVPAEWPPLLARAGVTGAKVRRVFPWRLCVARLR